MFTVYYSNRLSSLADMLIHVQKVAPNPNPLEAETVLVQSLGMAQWLQMQIAEQTGVAANYDFPFPTSFLWQQYRLLFPSLPKENIFERSTITWRLMRLIPRYLVQPDFASLNAYLTKEKSQYSFKLFQLSEKIADLFDQYLVYRPHWLVHWENNQLEAVLSEIKQTLTVTFKNEKEILINLNWQAILWKALIEDIQSVYQDDIFISSHRAYLQARYFDKLDHLTETEKQKLPKRIFMFGISSLPATQLAVLKKLSEHCDVHLFFLNPSQFYWGDSVEDRALEKLALKQQLSDEDLSALMAQQGNQLLAMWGKQGREFLAQLVEQAPHEIAAFSEYQGETNLLQLKQAMLNAHNPQVFRLGSDDASLQFHACHSIMREVEVLHNQLLRLFEENPALSPKDIIVMSADIDQYAPYVQAVFSRYAKSDNRYIPFSLSDQKMTAVDPIIASFMSLLNLKESNFNAEALFDLFDVQAIRLQFHFSQEDVALLREWVEQTGIRMGLNIKQAQWKNYNSWENGLTRLLLGSSLKAENGIWQEGIAFNESYGLSAQLVGNLAKFIDNLTSWVKFIQQPQSFLDWQTKLKELVSHFYFEDEDSLDSLLILSNASEAIFSKIQEANFNENMDIEVIESLFKSKLNEQPYNLHFLAGKVNFCTLLPMRAIPFKVVCLLGMNEANFPRQHVINSFDLMQYAPKRGDRARRDDDRYLFLEALLSAQEIFYVSYVGQSPINNKTSLPSVLVSQLLDYLFEHLNPADKQRLYENQDAEKAFLQEIITQHPMTIFSPQNFTQDYYSYDKEWLNITHYGKQENVFLTKEFKLTQAYPTEILLDDLIAFVQHPLKYFFNYQLGIYFYPQQESIAEAEKFELNGLDAYQLREKLVTLPSEEVEKALAEEQLKGNLPASYFGKISAEINEWAVKNMRTAIANYLGESERVEVGYSSEINGLKVNLRGHIKQKFGNEVVFWKVSTPKDKDIIRLWIYALLLRLLSPEVDMKLIFCHDEKIDIWQFSEITAEQAKKQLDIYLRDYLENHHKLKWAVSHNLEAYFKKINEAENIAEYCREKIIALTEEPYFDSRYLNRLLRQNSQMDYAAIAQTTQDWFELMQQSKPAKKGK